MSSIFLNKALLKRLKIWQDTDVGMPKLTKIFSKWLHFRLYRKSITTFLF